MWEVWQAVQGPYFRMGLGFLWLGYVSGGGRISPPCFVMAARSISMSSSPKAALNCGPSPGLSTSSQNPSRLFGDIRVRNLAGVAPTFL